jgi:HEPN domain-containing protein
MPGRIADYRAWLEKAQNDLQNIENNLNAEIVPWDTVCFHAQQAAEKLLKAVLVHHGQMPPRGHDLIRLLEGCVKFDATLASLEQVLQRLAPYAAAVRYPGDVYEPEEQDGREAVDAARVVADAVKARLPR